MTQRMFLGGPADHRWIDIDNRNDYRVPVMRPILFRADPDPFSLLDNIVAYSRHRYRHPAWRVVLTFYVIPGYVIPLGESMPGWVEGWWPDQSPLCPLCRAKRAPKFDAVCNDCWYGEENA